MRPILDTGPWVALHCRNDQHHDWAKAQFAKTSEPLLTCEAVVSETCFLLKRGGFDPGRALQMIERGVIQVAMRLDEEISVVRELFDRYDNVPASLADACLIRMSELFEPSRVLTLVGDFHIYRRHGSQTIPLLAP